MMQIVSCESTAGCNAMAAEQLAMVEAGVVATAVLVAAGIVLWQLWYFYSKPG